MPCELEGVSIVLLGNFNPSIFQPAWLAAHELIRKEESDVAQGVVFSRELAAFTADWLTLQVTQERFDASTADAAHFEPLRDLVLGIFTLLEHTPFDKMGLNRQMHYRMATEEQWNAFGDFLAPKAAWGQIMTKPGLRSLTIEGSRDDAPLARIHVKAEPSTKIHPGIFISTNEHHVASGAGAGKELLTVLQSSWTRSQAYAKRVAEHLLSQSY